MTVLKFDTGLINRYNLTAFSFLLIKIAHYNIFRLLIKRLSLWLHMCIVACSTNTQTRTYVFMYPTLIRAHRCDSSRGECPSVTLTTWIQIQATENAFYRTYVLRLRTHFYQDVAFLRYVFNVSVMKIEQEERAT